MTALPVRPLPRLVAAAGTALALAAAALLASFLWFLLRVAGATPAEGPLVPDPGWGIAVLTGGPDRVEAGLTLLAARPEARLIISGVGLDAGLADLAREAGMDAAPLAGRVALGRAATSTRGNAREVAAWARGERIREITVVTAGFHMPRALLELRRDLPEALLHPHPVAPRLARPLPMLREYAKLVGAAAGLSTLADEPRPQLP